MLMIDGYRVRVGPARVARLLEVRGAALAEFRERVHTTGTAWAARR
jgi:hypothetical protein